MKIEPGKNLKKPAYAIGAAMLAATLLTGCPSDEVMKVRTGSGTGAVKNGGIVPAVTDPDIMLEGETESFEPDPTEEFVLEGDVAVEDIGGLDDGDET